MEHPIYAAPVDDCAGRASAGCVGARLVRLFMSDSADGPFARTGNSDTSEQQGDVGVWSFGNTGLRDGFFYAKAKKTTEVVKDKQWSVRIFCVCRARKQ